MLGLNYVQDFYVLDLMLHRMRERVEADFSHKNEKLLSDVEKAHENLSDKLANAMYWYLYLASFGEARHGADSVAKSCFIQGTIADSNRETAYKAALLYDPAKTLPLLEKPMFTQKWNHAFGGKKWKSIVQGALLYGTIPNAAFVDHAVDLQHNNGTAFSKHATTDIVPFSLHFRSRLSQSYMDFLNIKKEHPDILADPKSAPFRLGRKTASLLSRFWAVPLEFIYRHDLEPDDTGDEWSPPKHGNKVPVILEKITDFRVIYNDESNSLNLQELKSMVNGWKYNMTMYDKFLMAYPPTDMDPKEAIKVSYEIYIQKALAKIKNKLAYAQAQKFLVGATQKVLEGGTI